MSRMVKAIRAIRGVRQEELATAIGVTQQTFTQWKYRLDLENIIYRGAADPDGDTLSLRYQSSHSYHALVREFGRETILENPNNFGEIISRPLDKRENFIKRCVGMPGDDLEIRDQQIY